jgi:transposase
MTTFEIPLGIEGVEIEKVEITTEGNIAIRAISTITGTLCHKCDNLIIKPYGYGAEVVLMDLPALGRKVFITIRPPKYICEYCDDHPTTTQQADWYNRRSSHTKRYEEYILLSLVNSTVSDISIKEDIGYEAVEGIINRHISQDIDWRKIRNIDKIGIDEISLKKGHKDFVTIITGYADNRLTILGVLKDRTKETVKQFLSSIPLRIKNKIKTVCTDMYDGFVNAAKEVFGKKVNITIDRFHVARLYRKSLDNVRKQEMKRLSKELPKEEFKKFKGIMWMIRKDKKYLTDKELLILHDLFNLSPILGLVYALCDELTSIFNENITRTKARNSINKWKKRVKDLGLDCFDKFLSTLDEWLVEITNYFTNRDTSGFVEGLNNKIKVIKRRCYGVLNPGHLFQRIYLDMEGYRLFA